MPVFIKDPDATLDYGHRWAEWLQDGETITTSTWTVASGLVKGVDTTADGGTTAVVWLSGGTAGVDYQLTNHITTSMGRTDERTITIACRQR